MDDREAIGAGAGAGEGDVSLYDCTLSLVARRVFARTVPLPLPSTLTLALALGFPSEESVRLSGSFVSCSSLIVDAASRLFVVLRGPEDGCWIAWESAAGVGVETGADTCGSSSSMALDEEPPAVGL